MAPIPVMTAAPFPYHAVLSFSLNPTPFLVVPQPSRAPLPVLSHWKSEQMEWAVPWIHRNAMLPGNFLRQLVYSFHSSLTHVSRTWPDSLPECHWMASSSFPNRLLLVNTVFKLCISSHILMNWSLNTTGLGCNPAVFFWARATCKGLGTTWLDVL